MTLPVRPTPLRRRVPLAIVVTLAPALIVLTAFWLLPLAQLITLGADADRSGTPGYLVVVSSPAYMQGLLQTVALAAGTTLATLVIAGIAGCFLARHAFAGRSLLVALMTFPLAFPGVVVGFLIILLGGRQGLFASISTALTGDRWIFAYSLFGLFLGYLYFSIPRVILTVMAACETLDRSLEEAARSLGASHWGVVRDVIVPGLMPALISSGAICFATAMGAFGTAFTLGTRLSVTPIAIYDTFTNFANFAVAAALSVLLGVVTWLVLMLARYLAGPRSLST
ncbi:ABC transporter permease [Pseudomonas matsuisoli]|uniref:ABC transporter permease n=1 Tax=Pseudomonas matsuisoli TaxID=1515666 RepID=A0A917PS31_9PSED|nr:ABC transporter permease [Pseudomonas matsuisoli]GGJ88942.1 ABC transporter permease [Pseudomonas matsuisoli]